MSVIVSLLSNYFVLLDFNWCRRPICCWHFRYVMCVFISIVVTIWSVSAASPPAFSALKLVHLRECLISVTRSPCSVCRRSAVCRRRSAPRVLSRLAHGVRTIAPPRKLIDDAIGNCTLGRTHRTNCSRESLPDFRLLTATGFVNWKWQCLIPNWICTPQPITKIVTDD